MMDSKKPVFNADNAEDYFTMLCTSYRDTANDIFKRDNEGRHASEHIWSAEYQKYLGMQIAMREVLEYFSKFELVSTQQPNAPLTGWISVKDRLPEAGGYVVCIAKRNPFSRFMPMVARIEKNGWVNPIAEQYISEVTHWMPLPEPPEEDNHADRTTY